MDINTIYNEGCLETMKRMEDNSIDLIVTSPPYADRRKSTYGGIHPDEYAKWFLGISSELKRVLSPSGSFILNIKENVVDGERHTYVLELIGKFKLLDEIHQKEKELNEFKKSI